MAKKKRKNSIADFSTDPISEWLSTLRLRDLKRAVIMRGISFRLLGELSVQGLQSWVFRNYYNQVNPRLLEDYDKWRDETLIDEGYIDDPIHIDLKLGYYAEAEDGTERRQRRDVKVLGAVKTEAEVASFKPKKGSKKTLVFSLIDNDWGTKDIIEEVQEVYPGTTIGTIKVWCSQARKRKRIREKLNI